MIKKNQIILFLTFLNLFVFVGCSSKVDKSDLKLDDFKNVRANMSGNQIEEMFGEPDEMEKK